MDATPDLAPLCRRLAASDRTALAALFRLLRPDLIRYARSIVGSDAVAHDVVQDVFVALWELRSTLDPARPLRNYVYRMTRNRSYRHLRDERLHAQKEPDVARYHVAHHPPPDAPDETIAAKDIATCLWQWVDELPPRQREALFLSRHHGLSHAEVASVMQVSPRTVNNHIVRALDELQNRLRAFETLPLDR